MVGGWLGADTYGRRRSAVVQLTCRESAVCCTCASVARVAFFQIFTTLYNWQWLEAGSQHRQQVGTRASPAAADLKSASIPGPACLLGGRMPARRRHGGAEAPQAPRAPRRGACSSPSVGVATTSRDPKTNLQQFPSNSRPLSKLKKNSPSVYPAFIAVVGVLLRVVVAAGAISGWTLCVYQ